jgi:hypothetical protein
LTRELPRVSLRDLLPFEAGGAGTAPGAAFRTVDLKPVATSDASALRESLRLADWFPQGRISSSGIPFDLLDGPTSAAATGLAADEGRIAVPLSGRAAAIALLLAARLEGDEEPVFGGGPWREIRDTDRAIFRVHHAEGPCDEAIPLSLCEDRFTTLEGPQVAIVFADPSRDLREIEIVERSPRADLVVLAATIVPPPGLPAIEARRPSAKWPDLAAPRAEPVVRTPWAVIEGTRLSLPGGEIDLAGLRISRLVASHVMQKFGIGIGEGSHLLRLAAGGREIPPSAWTVRSARVVHEQEVAFEVKVQAEELELLVRGAIFQDSTEILWDIEVEAIGCAPEVEISSPDLRDVRIADPATDILCYPKRGAAFTSAPCSFSRPATGLFPVQFMDVSCAAGTGGLYVRTEDRSGMDRLYEAAKGAGGTRLAVVYPRRLEPGVPVRIPRTVLGAHNGDWHEAFWKYRLWLDPWHEPRRPLKEWFREIFNFRQRFLWFWDPVYDPATGRLKVAEAIEEARGAFGGIEVLHLMDFGSHPQFGRVYGRTGDHAPWDAWKGGAASMAEAMGEARAAGVPVGIYVEGYLLEERGKLGSGPGKAWQILGPAGERRYWPGATEMFICPWVEPWREVQVDTYARLASMFPARGFYIDQFGFADWGKKCWSPSHGHPVPATPLEGERELTRRVSEALESKDPQIAVYTEETPADVANMFQDGSFTYAMNEALRFEEAGPAGQMNPPLNIARFAFPDFKTFEILICDQPTGSWATGVLWTFFNGEGIWLEGPAREWFRPRTLEAIRKAHAILREHRDAFMGTACTPWPLVKTLARGIFANSFNSPDKEVFTLWSSHPVTYRGPVLELPERRTAFDAWNGRKLEPRPLPRGKFELSVEIAPRGVGCIVVTR